MTIAPPPGSGVALSHWVRAVMAAPVADVARRTPVHRARQLSQRLGMEVMLKREDLQRTHSFKVRGAYNRMVQLSADEKRYGVLAVSAGNHAQGVALAAARLGIEATVVMPRTVPQIKSSAVAARGAHVILHGDTFDDAQAHGLALARSGRHVLIHPFDDDAVIAGQGTVARELLGQMRPWPDVVFIPVGGGGLCAGMAAYLKALHPTVHVVGVEPSDAACLYAARNAGEPVDLSEIGLFVDGCAVRRIGARPFDLLQSCLDELVLVDSDAVCAAMRDVFLETRAMVEPAGALAVAGLIAWAEGCGRGEWDPRGSPRRAVAVLSGANVAFERLAHVVERACIGSHEEALLGATIPERPGSFRELARTMAGYDITEFNYRRRDRSNAQVYVGVRLRRPSDRESLMAALRQGGYAVADYTQNESARNHMRHLVGGPAVKRERHFRFEFPERPGALLHFLDALADRWNISLFHYRNHGAAYGRVLAALEVEVSADTMLDGALRSMGFVYSEETDNAALRQFLT